MPPTGKHKQKQRKEQYTLNDKPFKWSFDKCLWDSPKWIDCKSVRFFVEHIVSKLQHYTNGIWQEVLDTAGAKSEGHGNNNHFIPADELSKAFAREFVKAGYDKRYDKIFSLRLSNLERLIGVVDFNMFYILWYDARHEAF